MGRRRCALRRQLRAADDGRAREHDGQVWFCDPRSETVTLKTIFGVNPDPAADGKNFDGPDSEFTGPAFSADGKVLFANIQAPGHVFAITGPWGKRRRG